MAWPFATALARRAERVEPRIKAMSPENPSTSLSNPDAWMVDWAGGGASFAGPMVSERSAMRSSTVYRCVSLVAGLIASLPLGVFERTKTGRETAINHRCYPLLHDEPNDLMGSFTWRELIGSDLLLGGNHYSLIERDNANRVVGFLPLQRQTVTPYRDNGLTKYRVTVDTGTVVVEQADMIHVPGIGYDGLRGMSPIAIVGKQPIGLDLAMTEQAGRFHANGVVTSGAVEVPQAMNPDVFKRVKQQFTDRHSGLENVGKPIFLDGGSKWVPMSMTNADAQTLETHRFEVTQICRIFGVPPHMVGEVERTTSWGTGIEQQAIGFLRFTLEPWLKRIEDEFQRKLFSRTRYYSEFNRDALLAMDSAARSNMLNSAIQNGRMTPAEARQIDNLPFLPNSDRLFMPVNLAPIDNISAPPPPSPDDPPAPGTTP